MKRFSRFGIGVGAALCLCCFGATVNAETFPCKRLNGGVSATVVPVTDSDDNLASVTGTLVNGTVTVADARIVFPPIDAWTLIPQVTCTTMALGPLPPGQANTTHWASAGAEFGVGNFVDAYADGELEAYLWVLDTSPAPGNAKATVDGDDGFVLFTNGNSVLATIGRQPVFIGNAPMSGATMYFYTPKAGGYNFTGDHFTMTVSTLGDGSSTQLATVGGSVVRVSGPTLPRIYSEDAAGVRTLVWQQPSNPGGGTTPTGGTAPTGGTTPTGGGY